MEATVLMGLFDRLQSEIKAREKAAGLSIADILRLPDEQRKLVLWLIAQGQATLTEIATYLGSSEAMAQSLLNALAEKSFVRAMTIDGIVSYKIRFARKRGRELPPNLWQALNDKVGR